MIVYSNDGIEVRVDPDGFLCIRAWSRYIYILPKELADIAEAVETFCRRQEEPDD